MIGQNNRNSLLFKLSIGSLTNKNVMKEDVETRLLNSLLMLRKCIPGFLINSIVRSGKLGGLKKKTFLGCSCLNILLN